MNESDIEAQLDPQDTERIAEEIEIVKMSGEPIDEVLAIERDAFTNPWGLREFLPDESDGRWTALVALGEERLLVGYICAWILRDELHIGNIAVRADRRGLGHGARLLSRLLIIGEERGLPTAVLEVRASNLDAHRLYRHYGFREVGMRKGYYSDNGEDAIVMMKTMALRSGGSERG